MAGKTGHQNIEAMSKVCDGDAFVAAQEVGFNNLCEIVDGRPRGIDTLISHMRLSANQKNYSASTVVLEDVCPDKMDRLWNSMSRDDDVVGHFWSRCIQ